MCGGEGRGGSCCDTASSTWQDACALQVLVMNAQERCMCCPAMQGPGFQLTAVFLQMVYRLLSFVVIVWLETWQSGTMSIWDNGNLGQWQSGTKAIWDKVSPPLRCRCC